MRMYVQLTYLNFLAHDFQGIDGPIEFSGSTPGLDDFTIRLVDGMLS